MSQYLILIYDGVPDWAGMDAEASATMMAAYDHFGRTNAAKILGGNALQPTASATSIRPAADDGFAVTDGPFVETKETLGGYYLVEAADLDEAIALGKQIPVSHGGVEIRPVMVFS